MTHNILVIGGTGKTGSRVVENLTKLGHDVTIGSRNGSPAFDWDDPSTYAAALKGMDRAYIVYYPDLAVPGARDAISKLTEAALKQGLEKVVLLSGKGETEASLGHQIGVQSFVHQIGVQSFVHQLGVQSFPHQLGAQSCVHQRGVQSFVRQFPSRERGREAWGQG